MSTNLAEVFQSTSLPDIAIGGTVSIKLLLGQSA